MASQPNRGQNRPSDREKCSKIADAITAIAAKRRQVGPYKHLVGDLEGLGLGCESDLWQILPQFLDEIQSSGPENCYVGGHPPQPSYEDEIKGLELWAFSWSSTLIGNRMYLKFALKRDKNDNWVYVHVDVHKDRPK
jgi:hypothetical protein